jgi:hypothetical protein
MVANATTSNFATTDCAACSVRLVWNKGIAARCDRRIPDEFPDGLNYSPVPTLAGAPWSSELPDNLISNPRLYEGIQDGELVWVRLSWLRSFIKQVLPLVKAKFGLVVGDSDSCVPSELGSEADALLTSSTIVHWFSQNYDGTSGPDRISPLPIGIDFHMLSQHPFWGEKQASSLEQERTLHSIRQHLPPVRQRISQVYVDFAWQGGWGIRQYWRVRNLRGAGLKQTRGQILRKLRSNPAVFFQPERLPRSEMWRRRGQYAFVLSPYGVGLDCHRTWESLALGHIVLVLSSSLDRLFTDLPVVALRRWDEITPENLTIWSSRHSESAESVPAKLTSEYWVAAMRATVMHKLGNSRF